MARVAVLGGGSWGTALASVLAGNGHDTLLWAREPEVVHSLNAGEGNPLFLPGCALPPGLRATGDLSHALDSREVAVSVVPAQYVDGVWREALPALGPDTLVVSATKGIELPSLRRMAEVFAGLLPPAQHARFTVLSGPSFALEVAQGQPTAVVAASADPGAAAATQALFSSRSFRVYTNPDVIGVELGGALKNVMAIAAGATVGLGFGHNTMAALVTRGLAEMARLGIAMGARRETFSGLAGLGDLVLTCTGALSRNRGVGERLGRGETLAAILGDMRSVAEGVKTAEAVALLATRHGVEMPIAGEVRAMLVDGRPAHEALANLMGRDPKPEEWS